MRARRADRMAGARLAPGFTLAVAEAADDPDIRALLRATALPGSVRLSFEREPDSLAAGRIEGDRHAVLVARERATGRLAAIASRSSRLRFVNGRPGRVAYLGGLRIAAGDGRRHGLLEEGFALCGRIEKGDSTELCLASVVAEHRSARRRLERGGSGWPAFTPLDELVTMAIPAGGRTRRRVSDVEIVSGAHAGLPAIVDLLTRYNRRYQVAPCWTAADLESDTRVPGLRPDDFLVALRHGGAVGCAALWDQRPSKQLVVRGYSPLVARWRWAINAVGCVSGAPHLPPANTPLAFAHLSHFAVDDDEEEVAVALVRAARAAARASGVDYLALGLSARNPVFRAVRAACLHREYRSILYAGRWPDDRLAVTGLDGRPSHPDTAVL